MSPHQHTPSQNPPLAGLKVLELGAVLAIPSVGMFLAELGADVVKVEPPQGDMTRTWQVHDEPVQNGLSAYYASVNWGKRLIVLNAKEEADWAVLDRLIAQADVMLVNFKPGSAQRLGLDAESMLAKHPRLIYASVTGYGPQDSRAGFDAVIQAESGVMYLNRNPGELPMKMPVAMMDILAGHQLKQAILLALLQREQTGKGQEVQTSLMQAGVAALANQGSSYLYHGINPSPLGSEHPSIYPYGGSFRTRDDKFLVLAIGNDRQFRELCAVLAHPEWADDSRFAHNPQRVDHREALRPLLTEAILQLNRDSFLKDLAERGVPAAAVYDLQEAFEQPAVAPLIMQGEEGDAHAAVRGLRTVAFHSSAWQPQANMDSPQPKDSHRTAVLRDWLGE